MSKHLQYLLLAVSISILSGTSIGQTRWTVVTTAPDLTWYVDKTSIKKTRRGTILAWEKVTYQDNSYNLALKEWKCSEKMKRFLQVNTYYSTGDIKYSDKRILPWRNIVPESIDESTYYIVCSDYHRKNNIR